MSKFSSALFPFLDGLPLSENSMAEANYVSTAKSVKCLDVTFWTNLRWSFHISESVNHVIRQSFQIHRLRQFDAKQTVSTFVVHQCVLPISLYYSPFVFPRLYKNDFLLLCQGLCFTSQVFSAC